MKNARISSDKLLDDISRDTNISKYYLEALEDNNYDIFPGPVYVRGFLDTYAKYLKLDSEAIIGQYEKLTAFNELVESGAFQPTAHRRSTRSVIRKRLIMLLFAAFLVVACLVALILKRT